MKGKWAAGIPPRNFTWIIKDHLAVSERPGGFAPNHRRVRRQEEIIWLRVQGFGRVISLLPSPHNLAAYDDEGLAWAHYPLERTGDPRPVLAACYHDIDASLAAGLRILMHQDELGDRLMGVVAGYLVWSDRITNQPQAVALVEHFVGHAMGEPGRELLSELEGHAHPQPSRRERPIEVRDLRVTGVHGVLPEERERAQPFAVDLVAWVDLEAAQQSDDLADTVDYGALAQAAADVVGGRSYQLLEALAGRLASALLIVDARIEAVEVTVRKLRPPLPLDVGSTGVRVRRAAADGRRAPAAGRAFIGLGSNLGDRRALLAGAVSRPAPGRRRGGRLAPLRDRAGGRARRARAPS